MQLQSDLVTAMKAGDTLRVSVLRMVLSAGNYEKINVQHELNDEEWLKVVAKEAKKRREAIESYQAAGRDEQVQQEQQELKVLEEYLPTLLTKEEIKDQIAKSNILDGFTDFGQAMRVVSPVFKGKADGQMVAQVVKELVG